MRSHGRKQMVLAALLLVPAQATAGTIIYRPPVVYYRRPVFRPVPTFRAPAYRPSYGSPGFRSAPSIPRSGAWERLRTYNPANPWAGMPPQIRNRTYVPPQQTAPLTARPATPNAEADLLQRLHVAPSARTAVSPITSEPAQRAAVANQAETQLLGQLHASSTTSVVTIIPPRSNAAAADSAETSLLKSLQTPSTTVTTIRGPLQTSAPSTYSFSSTPSGTVQVYQNGKLIGTGTASYAQQYGYHLPNPPIQSTPIATQTRRASPVGSPTTTEVQQPATPTVTNPVASNASPGTSVGPFTTTEYQNLKNNAVSLQPPSPQSTTSSNQAKTSQPTSYNTTTTGFSNTGGSAAGSQSQLSTSLSFNASAVQRSAQLGQVQATIGVDNISGGLSANAGPLSASAGANLSASVVRGQVSDAAAGVTLTGNAGYAEASAAASISPVGGSLSFGAGAYLVQGSVDKQVTVGNYNVNLGVDGGVGLAVGVNESIGLGGSAGGANIGPVGVTYSVTPN